MGGGDTAASKPAMPAHAETNPINAMYEREDGRDMEWLESSNVFNPPNPSANAMRSWRELGGEVDYHVL